MPETAWAIVGGMIPVEPRSHFAYSLVNRASAYIAKSRVLCVDPRTSPDNIDVSEEEKRRILVIDLTGNWFITRYTLPDLFKLFPKLRRVILDDAESVTRAEIYNRVFESYVSCERVSPGRCSACGFEWYPFLGQWVDRVPLLCDSCPEENVVTRCGHCHGVDGEFLDEGVKCTCEGSDGGWRVVHVECPAPCGPTATRCPCCETHFCNLCNDIDMQECDLCERDVCVSCRVYCVVHHSICCDCHENEYNFDDHRHCDDS